jgi:hypothetical protein
MSRYENVLSNFDVYFAKVLSDIGKERSLSFEDVERLKESPAFRLVVLTPFISDCDYAEMFAYANASTLITAGKHPEVFNPTKDISIETRATLIVENLKPFVKNKKNYNLCKKALVAVSIVDHQEDIEADKKEGKFNPLFDIKSKEKYNKKLPSIFNELEKDKTITKFVSVDLIKSDGFWSA